MREFVIYHMRRHDPPVGTVHMAADPIGTVQATSAHAALMLAKQKYSTLLPHIAVGDKEDVIHESVQKTIARANRSVYARGGAAHATGNQQPPRVLRRNGADVDRADRAASVRTTKGF
jgi:hypothetical protein